MGKQGEVDMPAAWQAMGERLCTMFTSIRLAV